MSRRRSKRPDPPPAKQAPVRPTTASARRRLVFWASVGIVLLAALAYRQYVMAPERWLQQSAEAAARGDGQTALQLAEQATRRWERSAPAWLAAARAANQIHEGKLAVRYYRAAAGLLDGLEGPPVLLAEARSLLGQRRLAAAEVCLRRVLDFEPDNVEALAAMTASWLATGRRQEALPSMFRLAQLDAASLPVLASLASPGIWVVSAADVEKIIAGDPANELAILGRGEIALRQELPEQAAQIAYQVLRTNPDQPAALSLLARCLIAQADWKAFAALQPQLEDLADDPHVWVARADWAAAQGQTAACARCLWEALRREPLYLTPNHRLAEILPSLQRSAEAAAFAEYADQLRLIVVAANRVLENPAYVQLLLTAAEALERCGCLWESRAWCGHVLRLAPHESRALQLRTRLETLLRDRPPRILPDHAPALTVDLSDLPGPDYTHSIPSTPRIARGSAATAVRFQERTVDLGLQFEFFAAPDEATPGVRMFEFTGGGAGVLDYDLDGWPDLYFTQGCRWPPVATQREFLDRFFRNDAGERVVDVSAASGLEDAAFSQGVACGDYDSDGFPDVFVGNLGASALYCNQGDGAFVRVELPSQPDRTWTTSCVLADLNGDAWADIYEARYVDGEADLTLECQDGACCPTVFDFGADRLLLGGGDGTLRDASAEGGLSPADGPGLGVLAVPSAQAGKLDIVLANDQWANAFFVHASPVPGEVAWSDQGVASGLAYDADGNPQACMGIAADDADGDGAFDVYVTNFWLESNTLYLQSSAGLFTDATRECGLRAPSWEMLGFGAQFLDADLDGWPDLVIANGHIHDRRRAGQPYAMRPQLMRNRGSARFEEVAPERAGDYFQRELRGRGLARLDFNRDGREDFAVSHIDDPASLVLNVSPRSNHALLLRLRGVRSHRDAYGARLVVRVGQRTLHRWLIPGGYFASHEPQFVVGLGTALQADEVQLTWPSGEQQVWRNLAVDRPWLVREGNAEILALPYDVLAAD